MAVAAQAPQQPRSYNNPGYNLPNGTPNTVPLGPVSAGTPANNQGRIVQAGGSRVLCVADVRGNLQSLNELAKAARADFIIHTGDFGFYDERSLDRIAEKTLKHVIQYSPLVAEEVRRNVLQTPPKASIKDRVPRNSLSQLPAFLNKTFTLDIPVYTVWGACEDVQVLEKLRSGEYKIDNLHIIDEAHSKLIEVGGLKLRLLGLGGAVVMHKLFDNGEGKTTIAGGQGTMWTTLLQIGELVETSSQSFDPTETRILITHASPAREGLLNQLCVSLKVDFSISAGLHFRYGSSYNEFSVNPTLDHYRGKLAASKASFNDVWETVRSEVEPAVEENETQKKLLGNALDVIFKMPSVANGGNPFGGHVGPNAGVVDETAFKNMWNFNLADAAFGWLVLEVENGRIGTEMRAQGFNFAHRGIKNPALQADTIRPIAPSPDLAGPTTANLPSTAPPPQAQSQLQPTAGPAPASSQPRATGPGQTGPPPTYPTPSHPRQPQQYRQHPAQQQPPPGRPETAPLPATQQPSQSQPQQQSQSPQQPQRAQQVSQTQQPQTSKPMTPATSGRSQPPSAPQGTVQSNTTSAPPQQPTTSDSTGSASANIGVAGPTTNGIKKEDNAAEAKNKNSVTGGAASESTQTRDTPPPFERKPTDGIFITGVSNEEELRNLFSEDDRKKILRIEKRGTAWIAHFASIEEAAAILDAAPSQIKGRGTAGKPAMKPAFDQPTQFRRHDGTGGWNGPARGGVQQGAPRPPVAGEGEAGRGGRGSFRGRSRGNDRGRGGRGGRGAFSKGAQGEGTPSSTSTPAPAAASGSS